MNGRKGERQGEVENPERALKELRRIQKEFLKAKRNGRTDAIWTGIEGLMAIQEAQIRRDREVERRLAELEGYLAGYDPRSRPGPMATEGYVPPAMRLGDLRPDVLRRIEQVFEYIQKAQKAVMAMSIPKLIEGMDETKDVELEVERLASSVLDDADRYKRVCIPTRRLLEELGYSEKTLKRYTDLLVRQGRLRKFGGAGGRREDNYVAFGLPPDKWNIWYRVNIKTCVIDQGQNMMGIDA